MLSNDLATIYPLIQKVFKSDVIHNCFSQNVLLNNSHPQYCESRIQMNIRTLKIVQINGLTAWPGVHIFSIFIYGSNVKLIGELEENGFRFLLLEN